MSTKQTCSYAVKDIGDENDGSCNASSVRKYSEEAPLCRLHYFMSRCEMLEAEIEELMDEELICESCGAGDFTYDEEDSSLPEDDWTPVESVLKKKH